MDLNDIYKAKHNFIIANYIDPDYVMIHPKNKRKILESIGAYVQHDQLKNITRIEGIKAIWTEDIKETDIIFTCADLKRI